MVFSEFGVFGFRVWGLGGAGGWGVYGSRVYVCGIEVWDVHARYDPKVFVHHRPGF